MSHAKIEFQFGNDKVTLETGQIARQANGAVMVTMGETVILATCVADLSRGQADFFPLTVDYQERTYAAGKIPGGFFRREGRPSEKETLTCRLIDRPIRPLFPKSFKQEVQVIATVLSLDSAVNPDITAMIGASAAVTLAGLPFAGPIGAARVGYTDGKYQINPPMNAMDNSALNMVVAGTADSVLMVESEAAELSEEVMLGAVTYAHKEMQVVIDSINQLVKQADVTPLNWNKEEKQDDTLLSKAETAATGPLTEAYRVIDKIQRRDALAKVRTDLAAQLVDEDTSESDVRQILGGIESRILRSSILNEGRRVDGRALDEIRAIHAETGILPRVHGSALFTRGETQALVVSSIGTDRSAQVIDAIEGEYRDWFMFHYNFPPFCVGETGRVGTPKRREIGHGRLAKRGLIAVMPNQDDFPYVIRIVSEITESNGSSSMASVCGASLSMMDAGIPIKAPVAGIAMGLVKEGDQHRILSDIMGDEDHLGDMDFKVAGSAQGVTALQMDIKISGVSEEIMRDALEQARKGRLHILEKMNSVIDKPRTQLSEYAPRITTMRINPKRIRDVIGKGGVTIRSLTEETNTIIDVTDDGTVKIFSSNQEASDLARSKIEELTADIEVGKIYNGTVVKLMDFGAFVTILPGRDGLLHISQISEEPVDHVSDCLSEGDQIKVKVLEVDRQGRVRLSMKEINR